MRSEMAMDPTEERRERGKIPEVIRQSNLTALWQTARSNKYFEICDSS